VIDPFPYLLPCWIFSPKQVYLCTWTLLCTQCFTTSFYGNNQSAYKLIFFPSFKPVSPVKKVIPQLKGNHLVDWFWLLITSICAFIALFLTCFQNYKYPPSLLSNTRTQDIKHLSSNTHSTKISLFSLLLLVLLPYLAGWKPRLGCGKLAYFSLHLHLYWYVLIKLLHQQQHVSLLSLSSLFVPYLYLT